MDRKLRGVRAAEGDCGRELRKQFLKRRAALRGGSTVLADAEPHFSLKAACSAAKPAAVCSGFITSEGLHPAIMRQARHRMLRDRFLCTEILSQVYDASEQLRGLLQTDALGALGMAGSEPLDEDQSDSS